VNAGLVILNPSPPVTLSEAKGLGSRLRVNSVKNLVESISWKPEILRLTPQNNIVTQSPFAKGGTERIRKGSNLLSKLKVFVYDKGKTLTISFLLGKESRFA
jgi:hypothetical protein